MFTLAGGSVAGWGPRGPAAKDVPAGLLSDGAESPDEDHSAAPIAFALPSRAAG